MYEEMSAYGLVGVECYYGEYDRIIQGALADAIRHFDLAVRLRTA